jgi:hypothetical protein
MIIPVTIDPGSSNTIDGPIYGIRFLTAPRNAYFRLDMGMQQPLEALFSLETVERPIFRLEVNAVDAEEPVVVQVAMGQSDVLTGSPTVPARLNEWRQLEVMAHGMPTTGTIKPLPLKVDTAGRLELAQPLSDTLDVITASTVGSTVGTFYVALDGTRTTDKAQSKWYDLSPYRGLYVAFAGTPSGSCTLSVYVEELGKAHVSVSDPVRVFPLVGAVSLNTGATKAGVIHLEPGTARLDPGSGTITQHPTRPIIARLRWTISGMPSGNGTSHIGVYGIR